MTLFDIFANLAYLVVDLFASLSVIGSAILAIGGVVAAKFGQRFRAPEQIYMWSWGGFIISSGTLICITISEQITLIKTAWFGYSTPTVVAMLAVSVLLLVVGKILQNRLSLLRQPLPQSNNFARRNRYD